MKYGRKKTDNETKKMFQNLGRKVSSKLTKNHKLKDELRTKEWIVWWLCKNPLRIFLHKYFHISINFGKEQEKAWKKKEKTT